MEPVSPQPSSQTPPTFAGGVVLTVLGGMTFLIFLLAVVFAALSDDWDLVFGLIAIGISIFGGLEVWAGILAMAGRPIGRPFGITIAAVGVAAALAGLWHAIFIDESFQGIVITVLLIAASTLVIVLLARARPPA